MLQPDERTLLAELLEPPEGYQLDHAIATTFTLDLNALLTIPLGFVGSDLNESSNKLSLMQSVQQFAGRIDVFNQRGMIKVPSRPNSLLAFLEPMIHQVPATTQGYLFHPKVWVLRFSHIERPDEIQNKFKFICGSRNLTFDRSWDAAISLEGEVKNRRYAYNNPLCNFLNLLPERVGGLSVERQKNFDETITQLNNVEWERPAGVIQDNDWLQFHTFGRSHSKGPELWGKRALIVSPYINTQGLQQFETDEPLIILSREEEINRLDELGRDWTEENVSTFYVVNDDASIRDLEDEESGAKWELTGLHAKLYLFERGSNAHLLIGSANATDRGWDGNDEILVEIIGKKNLFGIDALIGEKSEFRSVLLEHTLGEPLPRDENEDLRLVLENKLRVLSTNEFMSNIKGDDVDGWSQVVESTTPLVVGIPNVQLEVSLVTAPHDIRPIQNRAPLQEQWKLIGIENATPLIVLTLRSGDVQASVVVLSKLLGAPDDRLDRIIAQQFENKEMFLQFVALLLAASDHASQNAMHEFLLRGNDSQNSWMTDGVGLLEILLRALSRSPQLIDDVGRLVERLRSTNEGKKKLPDGWDELWASVTVTREMMGTSDVAR